MLSEAELLSAIQGKSGEIRIDCNCDGSQKETIAINADTGVYYCFRCQKDGNVFGRKGVMDLEKIWRESSPPNGNPYLKKKGVEAYGIKENSYKGSNDLIVPFFIRGRLSTLQFIKPNGGKVWAKGHTKKGASFIINESDKYSNLIICEGYATGASIHKCTNQTVVITGDAGNLIPAFENIPDHLKKKEIIWAADNDPTGLKKAREAARRFGGRVAVPSIEGQDFNDMHLSEGVLSVTDAIARAEARTPFGGITAAELLRKEFPEPKWAVEGILPEGLNILAGKPKQGKSILALNIALSIAMGGKAMQSISVEQGAVIYLALEDPPRRLQRRIQQMLTYTESGPDKLHLFTEFPRMGDGGIKTLDTLIEQTKDLRLVIIDTLALFKPPARGGNGNQYADEYEMVSRIKKIADKHGVSILLIHHLRKMQSDDVFEMFSGTLGLTGAADGLLAMTRSTSGPVLHITGRDVEPQELAMELDAEMLSWRLIGAAADVQSTKEKQLLYDTLKNADGPLSPKDIADITGLRHQYIRSKLPALVMSGVIRKEGYGKYIYINNTEYSENS